MPVYAGDEEGEFCTPTGAAILKHFATGYGHMPVMTFNKVGIGLGSKMFRTPNMLRAYLRESNVLPMIKEIKCNIDDMTSEDMGVMISKLIDNGALDAFLAPCIMKKGRPGFELTCLCRNESLEKMVDLILRNTSTIGLRVHECERYAMSSRFEKVNTEFGEISMKISEGFGICKKKPEFEDISKASERCGVPISEVRESINHKENE